MPPGRYRLGRAEVDVVDGEARVGGRLAGSLIGLDAALRNIRAFTGTDDAAAIATVSSVPARLLGISDRGHLDPGATGDLTLLTAELEVAATIVAGDVVFAAEGLGWG
jgi:N-acetylglucosamine-6-phosphate deacetylase